MSTEGEPKRLDVEAIIEAKRQRLAGKATSARHEAEKKAEQAMAESARHTKEKQAQPKVRKEFFHERLAREHEEKKRHAALLREVTLVPIDKNKPVEDETEEELDQAPRKQRSSRRRRSRTSRTLRSRGSRSSSSGIALALGIVAAVIVVGGLLFKLLS